MNEMSNQNNPITCVIIEDEPLAQNIYHRYLAKLPDVQLLATCSNALEAISVIQNTRPDFILLDINLPEMTGFEMLNVLRLHKPLVIFSTAHVEYAFKSYDFDALDYLLKPVSFDKFIRSIEKVKEMKTIKEGIRGGGSFMNVTPDIRQENDSAFVKFDKKNIRLNFNNIWMIQAMEDYLKIFLIEPVNATGYIVIRMTMKDIESKLPEDAFLRISRSYIVKFQEIVALEGNEIKLKEGHRLQIGRTFKDEVRKRIEGITM
ncbi:hypothetical protein DSL64_03605 [Dyadobacter luteus]|jgi:two-component system LytT family response regulator|uniref:DNA-binding response regulator n=1 Tax=Dyadobacter luteus TaxID=2259619 RepID=A0A3D8YFV6_9BACT|nr:LytTR family DNA-binding domain-containing protein [Dyadobacter luteus]REA63541.1 hypothetical protein DSL64_03605 [Dyadobacter luteus]